MNTWIVKEGTLKNSVRTLCEYCRNIQRAKIENGKLISLRHKHTRHCPRYNTPLPKLNSLEAFTSYHEMNYMNAKTGSVDTAENWISENDENVLNFLIEVIKNENGEWVEIEIK